MRGHTSRTRLRCERLADRTASDRVVVGLLAALLLSLVHPLGSAVALLGMAGGRRLMRRPT